MVADHCIAQDIVILIWQLRIVLVIGKHDTVCDKAVLTDFYALADKRMAADFRSLPIIAPR